MRLALTLVSLIVLSCASSARPPAAEPPEVVCAAMGHGGLFVFVGADPALAQAEDAFAAAIAAEDDPRAAAASYLACAAAYRAVPADFAELEHVLANAQLCYQSAIIAYGNARLFEAEGRAAVTAALADEPRGDVKAAVAAALAATRECDAAP